MIATKTDVEVYADQQAGIVASRGGEVEPVIARLATHVLDAWNRNKQAKSEVERRIIANMRQIKGEYDPDVLAAIHDHGGSEIYIRLTAVKCDAAKSWLSDIMMPPGERPFNIDPTPIPDLPSTVLMEIKQQLDQEYLGLLETQGPTPEVMGHMEELDKQLQSEMQTRVEEEAKDEAERTEKEIDDELVEGGWYRALRDVIDDVVDYPTGFLEGPIVRKKPVMQWDESGNVAVVEKIVREYERLSPVDVYPAPGARTLQEGELILVKRFTRKELYGFVNAPHFDGEAIRKVLREYPDGFLVNRSIDQEVADIVDDPDRRKNSMNQIDTLHYYGCVSGRVLKEWGEGSLDIEDEEAEYEAVVYQVDQTVISARLNPHPLGQRPIYGASLRRNTDSVWGDGVPDLMADTAKMCNAAGRALADNMGMSSGPMAWQNTDAFHPGQDTTIEPRKVWQFTSEQLISGAPMGFFNVESHAAELMGIFKYFYDLASEVTGIPAYVYGSDKIGGAGKTASGLSMLMNAASKGLKRVARNIDAGVVTPSVEECWTHIMLFEPGRFKGDINIVARASEYLVQAEQIQLRLMEFMDRTANPLDAPIIGPSGRAELLREAAKSLKLPVNRVVPDQKGLDAQVQQNHLMGMLQNISAAIGVPVEALMQMAQQGGQQQPQQGDKPRLPEAI